MSARDEPQLPFRLKVRQEQASEDEIRRVEEQVEERQGKASEEEITGVEQEAEEA